MTSDLAQRHQLRLAIGEAVVFKRGVCAGLQTGKQFGIGEVLAELSRGAAAARRTMPSLPMSEIAPATEIYFS
jgi:hypothetical protein